MIFVSVSDIGMKFECWLVEVFFQGEISFIGFFQC